MTEEGKAVSAARALADIATDEDKLFNDGYVKGIAQFIKECATPMTIAIQGDWGTGKSSLINLIETELRAEDDPAESGVWHARKYCEDIISVAIFDAWQQSVVNPNASLSEGLLIEMIAKLSVGGRKELAQMAGLASAASQIAGMMAGDAGNASDSKEGSLFDSIVGSLFGSDDDAKSEPENDLLTSESVEDFQAELVDVLKRCAEEGGKSADSRFVVIVDGLDHIDPEAAVNLMERIKTFLDCPQCVFVLAIDEKTVFEGARKRLGDKADDARKKMFFDKFVQVPLRIPMSTYNLEKYISDLLKDEKEFAGEFTEVLGALLKDPAPATIKRCINTTYLYRNVFGGPQGVTGDSLAMLLAAVTLEIESPRGFDAVVGCAHDEAQFEESLKAALDSLELNDRINWGALSGLWRGGDGTSADLAKRSAFLSWVQQLK